MVRVVTEKVIVWLARGAIVGVIAGLASAVFLVALDRVTDVHLTHPWLLYLLPLGGLGMGLLYHHVGGRAGAGTALIVDELHSPTAWVPRRMAPLVLLGTLVTHLFGGSAGREGTAVQMSGSLTDWLSRHLRLQQEDRRTMLRAAVGGGFAAVFGVPIAGCVFAFEVRASRVLRAETVLTTAVAAFVGDRLVRVLGVDHTPIPRLPSVQLTAGLITKTVVLGVACGLTGAAFVETTHRLRRLFVAAVAWPPARPLIGGIVIIAVTAVVGSRAYLGLSIPLLTGALAGGVGVAGGAFALKLAFTALTLGSGFYGGEVTPLFVIGATLGVLVGRVLDAPIAVTAALGFVAVFAGAANTPAACAVMGVELFGPTAALLFAVVCISSYACSTHRGIYGSRRRNVPAATAR